jgi:pyruvate formate lyase activating enzyme
VGRRYNPEELADLLLRDRRYYQHSGGGVTLSGGEATLYPDFVEACLQRVRRGGVHVLLETCGEFDYAVFSRQILPYVQEVYFDLKLADPEQHRQYTGRRNDRTIANLRRLVREPGVRVTPRVPLVSGVTATPTNLAAIVALLGEVGLPSVTLLPYNPLGLSMYEALGRPRPPGAERFMSAAELEAVHAEFARILAARASPAPAGVPL